MKKNFLISTLFFLITLKTIAQQIPLGSCGIIYIYDDAGNRTKRLYYCNNGGPYPTFANADIPATLAAKDGLTPQEIKNMEFQTVDALYPNPTSGMFYITFGRALQSGLISITDNSGKLVQQFKASGFKIGCNLAAVAAGTYFIKIKDGDSIITKKVVKQ